MSVYTFGGAQEDLAKGLDQGLAWCWSLWLGSEGGDPLVSGPVGVACLLACLSCGRWEM